MRRTALSTFLIVAILGLGCMGVSAPGKADELKHPIELGKECKVLFEEYLWAAESLPWIHYYNAFAYAYGASGSYACSFEQSPRSAVERCNKLSSGGRGDHTSFPPGTRGDDLGGCKVYAKSPVDGKLAIVWKEEPKQVSRKQVATKEVKQVAAKHQTISGTGNQPKPWAGYQSKPIEDGGYDLTIRYSESGDKYFAVVEDSRGTDLKLQGAVDERGNLETVGGTGDLYFGEIEITGNVLRIKVAVTPAGSSGSSSSLIFADKTLAQRIKTATADPARNLAKAKAEAEQQRLAELKTEGHETQDSAKNADRKLFAKLAPGAKAYLADVMVFLKQNIEAPDVMDTMLSAAMLKKSLKSESGKAVKASLDELNEMLAKSDGFLRFTSLYD
jgi:hypothetical protein